MSNEKNTKPGMNFVFSRKSFFPKLISLTSDLLIFLNYSHFLCKTIISCSHCSTQPKMILTFTFSLSSDCQIFFFNFPLIARSDNPRIGLKNSFDCQIFRKKSDNLRSPPLYHQIRFATRCLHEAEMGLLYHLLYHFMPRIAVSSIMSMCHGLLIPSQSRRNCKCGSCGSCRSCRSCRAMQIISC